MFCFVVLPPITEARFMREITGGSVQAVTCLIPPEALALWSSTSVAPLIFYSVRCLCLCMMDVTLTQVNGRKFSLAFKCIAFLVLSKNILFLGKNILEASGIKSTELWPLMEFEALWSGLIGKNPFLFLSPWLCPHLHITKTTLLLLLFFETRVSDFIEFCTFLFYFFEIRKFLKGFYCHFYFLPWRGGKTLNCVQSKLNYEKNNLWS